MCCVKGTYTFQVENIAGEFSATTDSDKTKIATERVVCPARLSEENTMGSQFLVKHKKNRRFPSSLEKA